MKKVFILLSVALLINACNQPNNIQSNSVESANVENCPEETASLPYIEASETEEFYEPFNYFIQDITPTADTITFESYSHDFVYCRGNESWTIQPKSTESEASESQNYDEFLEEAANPSYKTITVNGQEYSYRVFLNPNPFPDFQQQANEVIFEFKSSESEQPQRQILYTLEDVEAANTGIQLGFPEVTATVESNNRIFWAVSPEQGEGNGGIATIVSYDTDSNELSVIQPKKIEGQQITDIAVAEDSNNSILWIGTQKAGEGNPYIPSLGLVSYRPTSEDWQSGEIASYRVENSPIVGAIPTQLLLENESLWVGTGNGICEVNWQTIETLSSWSCWRFALLSEVPSEGLPLYPSLKAETPAATLETTRDTVEVLWWSPLDYETQAGRYEVKYEKGFTANFDQGASPWEEYYTSDFETPVWLPPVSWVGAEWHWEENRFERGFDEVMLNYFGGGPVGLSSGEYSGQQRPDTYAMRGDLELLDLTANSTDLRYYSGWVEESLVNPYLTIVPQQRPENPQPNPLGAYSS